VHSALFSTGPYGPPSQIHRVYPRRDHRLLQGLQCLSPKWAPPMTTTYLYLFLVHMDLHQDKSAPRDLGLDASVLWRSV